MTATCSRTEQRTAMDRQAEVSGLTATLVDLSCGGAHVQVSEGLLPGQRVLLTLPGLRVVATVVACHDEHVHLRFLRGQGAEEVSHFLAKAA